MGRYPQAGQSAGRGRGRPRGKTTGNSSTSKKKTLRDYIFYIGSAKQASDYVSVHNYLLNHIQRTYEYGDLIGNALEQGTELDLQAIKPIRERSTQSDADLKKQEDEDNSILFKARIEAYIKRIEKYQCNKTKVYSFLEGQCSAAMKARIKS